MTTNKLEKALVEMEYADTQAGAYAATLADWSNAKAAAKAEFKKTAMVELRWLAKALKLPKDSYDLRWNEGGPAVSGEATLHHERLYVQVSRGCMGRGSDVLYRACKGRKDYCGLRNYFTSVTNLRSESVLAQMADMAGWE